MTTNADPSCIFCKIIKGEIPSQKISETQTALAFLDINPLTKGHVLVIPKYHTAKFHELPDEHLTDLLPTAKRIVKAVGAKDYNLLQNNGRVAHQFVDHVHFHIIPKPAATDSEGLVVGWPMQDISKEELSQVAENIRSRL